MPQQGVATHAPAAVARDRVESMRRARCCRRSTGTTKTAATGWPAGHDRLSTHPFGQSHEDAAYVLDTLPIVREQDMAAFGRWRTKDEVLAHLVRIRGGVLGVRSSPDIL